MIKDTNAPYKKMTLSNGVWTGITSNGHKLTISDKDMQDLITVARNIMIDKKGVEMKRGTFLNKLMDSDRLEVVNPKGLKIEKKDEN